MKPAKPTVSDIWPVSITVRDGGRTLHVEFDSGEKIAVASELLRVESPSAEVKGHGPGEEQLQWGKRDVTVTKADAVGNYAVRLGFSDGHSTGIFTWPYLLKLGREQESLLAAHLDKLAAAGKRR
jgi:DUF971 family protein